MLDKGLFADKMECIQKSYPDWRGNIQSDSFMSYWYDKFKEFSDDKFKEKVDGYIDEVGLRPNIARLKNYIRGQSNFAKSEEYKGLKHYKRG